MKDIDEVIDGYSGRARTVLLYTQTVKRLADAAKRPGFTADDWAPLAALVDTGEFERVGNFKEVMNWPEYLGFLSNWAPSSSWEASFKRISEVDGVVFLELEERSEVGDFTSVVNSLSVYEFTDDEKIRHIDLYLQMALPNMEMLDSYSSVEISE
ncbi:hypothetical protein [Mycolicibacter algericus]|uniref:Uncharacterized protein n=2 Tax=Mycolicibacter algericus TaxID=1288388 RepID=A0A7I9YD33_MYCAL|nr:hypothetical protein [Mycolicibacter algericus]OQZ97373.1 hypothetical protein BST10_10005 [Mycolicibacter algericus DSM 45454]GFG86546.1 hypothetical protein MALGJ_32220 [Mycolicibacter algericus]